MLTPSPLFKKIWARSRQSLALLLLTMPAWLPLLRITSLPCTHDNAFHYYRIAAMRDALRHGWLFSRWIPNLALGYGYPFFNYREPLPYVLGEALYALGLPLPLVLGFFYALSLIVAAFGAYVLSRELFGARSAWVGAVAYALAPYLLVDVYRRGNLPESIALAILPWLFIHFRTLIISGGRRAFIKALALLVMLFLSHNISSLLLVPFLGSYVVYHAWLYRSHRKWHLAFIVVILAALLTAWFWLPALLEQDMVQLNLSTSTRNNDFHFNFISWEQMLLQWPAPYDPMYLNPPMKITLGIGQGLLALLGVGLAFIFPRTKEQRGFIVLFTLAALGYLWMCTASSVVVWEAVPLLSFVQFPWRLVGRAILPVSLLAGSVFTGGHSSVGMLKRHPSYKRAIPAALLCATIMGLALSAYPETYPPKGQCALNPYPGIADVSGYELEGWIGIDPEHSYFPIWVEEHPTDTALADAFAAGRLPERLDTDRLPQGAEVVSANYRALRASISLTSPMAFRARWKGLYFPGWQVRVDGQRVQVTPEDDTGLITFDVPAGEHSIEVRFGSTPLRVLGIALLCIGIVIAVVLLVRYPVPKRKREQKQADKSWNPSGKVIVLLAVGLLLFKIGLVDRIPTPLSRSRLQEGRLPEVDVLLNQPFNDAITLLGYDISATALPGDGEIQVDLLWQATGKPNNEYRTVVLVMGPDGQASWSPAGTERPSGYEPPPSTTGWREGQYVYDPHIVALISGTPPGLYQLQVVIFDKDTLTPLPVVNSDGSPGEPALTLGTIEVTRPVVPFTHKSLGVGEKTESPFCNHLQLWSMTLDRTTAAPGDIVAVRWVWEKILPEGDMEDISNFAIVTLLDSDGSVAHTWKLPLSTDWWPVESWYSDELWTGRHVLRFPRDLEGGGYQVIVSKEACDNPLAAVDLTIEKLKREWAVPVHYTGANAVFGDRVILAGYFLEKQSFKPGDTVSLDLAWQAQAEMSDSYRVFVHLVDAAGRVVDQDDGEPRDWTRPTTGWLQGEVVTETRKLAIPAENSTGPYTLMVGLYVEVGTRLTLPAGEDALALTVIQVSDD